MCRILWITLNSDGKFLVIQDVFPLWVRVELNWRKLMFTSLALVSFWTTLLLINLCKYAEIFGNTEVSDITVPCSLDKSQCLRLLDVKLTEASSPTAVSWKGATPLSAQGPWYRYVSLILCSMSNWQNPLAEEDPPQSRMTLRFQAACNGACPGKVKSKSVQKTVFQI